MTATTTKLAGNATDIDAPVYSRILKEGYGAGAWHGPDLESAVADVTPALAFQRPGPGRHNIAEIALHHAWFARSVASQLSGGQPAPFLMQGEDWFEVSEGTGPSWPEIRNTLDRYQKELAKAVTGNGASALSATERFDLVLGITCHAVYHAGQIQLIKRLLS